MGVGVKGGYTDAGGGATGADRTGGVKSYWVGRGKERGLYETKDTRAEFTSTGEKGQQGLSWDP